MGYVRATRAGLPRWVRTGGAGRLAPWAPPTVRTGHAYPPRAFGTDRARWHPRWRTSSPTCSGCYSGCSSGRPTISERVAKDSPPCASTVLSAVVLGRSAGCPVPGPPTAVPSFRVNSGASTQVRSVQHHIFISHGTRPARGSHLVFPRYCCVRWIPPRLENMRNHRRSRSRSRAAQGRGKAPCRPRSSFRP